MKQINIMHVVIIIILGFANLYNLISIGTAIIIFFIWLILLFIAGKQDYMEMKRDEARKRLNELKNQ